MTSGKASFHGASVKTVMLLVAASIVACAVERVPTAAVSVQGSSAAARASSGGVVLGTVTPDSANLGTVLDVVVRGSNFATDARVDFALNGLKDSSQIRTNSTRYVSSSEVVANITVSSTATSGQWDVMMSGKTGIGTETDVFTVKDPSATWVMSSTDATLAVRGDGLYATNGASSYADGTCKVQAKIYATSEFSGTGDATIEMTGGQKGNACVRKFVYTYPDGLSETRASNGNLIAVHGPAFAIPVGQTIKRKLNLNSNGGRCGRLLFGEGPLGGTGSDSVNVTRVSGGMWHVESQGTQLAWCENNSQLYRMPVRFDLVSSTVFP
jgi:hypothetical protein